MPLNWRDCARVAAVSPGPGRHGGILSSVINGLSQVSGQSLVIHYHLTVSLPVKKATISKT